MASLPGLSHTSSQSAHSSFLARANSQRKSTNVQLYGDMTQAARDTATLHAVPE
ncbi:hypothetical protein PMIN01_12125 [Paraphaeosphaeria minitans]|uniref:Uncharacterized protein n=1 Tax=Paraphaeosphaeria minitans TaxID=565426 RepID=A0A9P6KKT7_9PLEO|nr:hypothetical protein PMIN01_12099 [Paraphaeosphaeria minitans]KAF9730192.1 hypothetical protein PMIN01_12125 [Paraphaeosphaeria minitans]